MLKPLARVDVLAELLERQSRGAAGLNLSPLRECDEDQTREPKQFQSA